MVGGTYSKDSANDVADGHAETCLGSLILKNADGTEHAKLIKMRNPWGSYVYDGPWSRKSDLWTDDFKKQAGFTDANFTDGDDGIFYTPLEDWTTEFQNLWVAHTADWKVNSVEGKISKYKTSKNVFELVTLTNPIKQDVFVECDQYRSRLWPFTDDNVCLPEDNHPQTYAAMIFNDNYSPIIKNWIDCNGESTALRNLAPGQYDIVVNTDNVEVKGNGIWAIRTFA